MSRKNTDCSKGLKWASCLCLLAASMASLAALLFVFDAACSVSAFGERLWEVTLVCCRWSCIMCRAFVTRSFRDRLRCAWCCNRRIVPSPPGVVPSLLPPTGSLPLGVTGRAAVAHGEQEADVCGYVGTSRFGWSRDKDRARQAERRKTGLHVKKAMEGPKYHCAGPGAASGAATVTFQDFKACLSHLISFSRRLSSPRFFLNRSVSLTMRVLFCCACLAEVNADGKMRCLIDFPYLKASVPGNTPVRHVLLCQHQAEPVS